MGGSIKYQPLVLATEQLTNWSMLGEHSIDSRERPISESPMVFNRLISGASTTSNLNGRVLLLKPSFGNCLIVPVRRRFTLQTGVKDIQRSLALRGLTKTGSSLLIGTG